MRNNFFKMTLLGIACCFSLTSQAQENKCNCEQNFDKMIEKLEANYIAYPLIKNEINQDDETGKALVSKTKAQNDTQVLQASLDAVGTPTDLKSIQNIIAFANCQSPQGNYTTEVHCNTNGYGYFKQVYSYRPQPFEAITKGTDKGFLLGEKAQALPQNAVFAMRSHYFHQLIINVKTYFHDFEKPEITTLAGKKVYEIKAKDEINHPCRLFFDIEKGFLISFHLQSPDNKDEILKTTFSDWKVVQNLQLPQHLEIDQGGKIFIFDFTKIVINSADFQEKKIE